MPWLRYLRAGDAPGDTPWLKGPAAPRSTPQSFALFAPSERPPCSGADARPEDPVAKEITEARLRQTVSRLAAVPKLLEGSAAM